MAWIFQSNVYVDTCTDYIFLHINHIEYWTGPNDVEYSLVDSEQKVSIDKASRENRENLFPKLAPTVASTNCGEKKQKRYIIFFIIELCFFLVVNAIYGETKCCESRCDFFRLRNSTHFNIAVRNEQTIEDFISLLRLKKKTQRIETGYSVLKNGQRSM